MSKRNTTTVRAALGVFGALCGSLSLGGCQEDRGVCLEPVRGWESRLLDRDAIYTLGLSLSAEPAYEMARAFCPLVPVGVDARNGETIFAGPFCDDDCRTAEVHTVLLFYSAATEIDCAALWGCTVESGASPGQRFGCGPEGRPPYPDRRNPCLAPCPVPEEGYVGISLDIPDMTAAKEPFMGRVVPRQLECEPAPVGVDARNGAVVHLEQDRETVLLTYGPASEGDWEACEALGDSCWAKEISDATDLFRCAPLALPVPYASGCY